MIAAAKYEAAVRYALQLENRLAVAKHSNASVTKAWYAARRERDEAKDRLALAERALHEIQAMQPEALGIIRENGFVWKDRESLGKEPGNWQHLSFTLYSMLCEAETIASSALNEQSDGQGG